MKLSHVAIYAALAATLAAGCSRRPKNITPLPHSDRVGGADRTQLTTATTPIDGGGGTQGNRNDLTKGQPLPDRTPVVPSDTGNTPTQPFTPTTSTSPPGDAQQVDRSNWETRPQDPDTLRGDTVYFDLDKSVVKRDERAKVAAIAEYLKGHPGYMLKLDGHADERGTEDYNRALGERRALSVREMLLNMGLSQDTIVTATFGEDRPAELGHNEAAWSKNRRVEPIVLLPHGASR